MASPISPRRLELLAGVTLVAASVLVGSAGAASASAVPAACKWLPRRGPAGLPAPVVVSTGCGRLAIGTDGRVRFLGPSRPLVPAGAESFPDATWYRLERGRLVVGRGRRAAWHSTGRYRFPFGVGAVALSRTRVAFSYAATPSGWRRPTLYLARLGGAETAVGRGETPVGWTRAGTLVTWGRKGILGRKDVLRLRRGDGRLERTLARGVHAFVLDPAGRAVLFLAHGRLERFDGRRLRTLARLKTIGLAAPLTIEPLGRLVALRGEHRLVALRTSGALVSSTDLPHGARRTDRVSSATVSDRSGDVAFAATDGNTAYGSTGTEAVYLLRPGARKAEPIYRERVAFAVCERQATLSWRGRWLLYSTSEGYAAAIDTSGSGARVDLSRTTRRLHELDGDDVQIDWSRWGSG